MTKSYKVPFVTLICPASLECLSVSLLWNVCQSCNCDVGQSPTSGMSISFAAVECWSVLSLLNVCLSHNSCLLVWNVLNVKAWRIDVPLTILVIQVISSISIKAKMDKFGKSLSLTLSLYQYVFQKNWARELIMLWNYNPWKYLSSSHIFYDFAMICIQVLSSISKKAKTGK